MILKLDCRINVVFKGIDFTAGVREFVLVIPLKQGFCIFFVQVLLLIRLIIIPNYSFLLFFCIHLSSPIRVWTLLLLWLVSESQYLQNAHQGSKTTESKLFCKFHRAWEHNQSKQGKSIISYYLYQNKVSPHTVFLILSNSGKKENRDSISFSNWFRL